MVQACKARAPPSPARSPATTRNHIQLSNSLARSVRRWSVPGCRMANADMGQTHGKQTARDQEAGQVRRRRWIDAGRNGDQAQGVFNKAGRSDFRSMDANSTWVGSARVVGLSEARAKANAWRKLHALVLKPAASLTKIENCPTGKNAHSTTDHLLERVLGSAVAIRRQQLQNLEKQRRTKNDQAHKCELPRIG